MQRSVREMAREYSSEDVRPPPPYGTVAGFVLLAGGGRGGDLSNRFIGILELPPRGNTRREGSGARRDVGALWALTAAVRSSRSNAEQRMVVRQCLISTLLRVQYILIKVEVINYIQILVVSQIVVVAKVALDHTRTVHVACKYRRVSDHARDLNVMSRVARVARGVVVVHRQLLASI